MKTFLNIVFVLFFSIVYTYGQDNPDQEKVRDMKKIELRPNKRDYGPVMRDNLHMRIDRNKNKAFYQKKKATIQQKRALLRKKQMLIRREQLNKRRQSIIQRRRSLRK